MFVLRRNVPCFGAVNYCDLASARGAPPVRGLCVLAQACSCVCVCLLKDNSSRFAELRLKRCQEPVEQTCRRTRRACGTWSAVVDVQVASNGMLAARANQGCVETGAGEAQAAPAREVQSRVVSELSREIRAVQQRKRRLEAVSASTRQGALMHAIASPLVGMVYKDSGRDPAITVDFVYGRGQSRRRHLEEASGMQAVAIFTDVEKVFSQNSGDASAVRAQGRVRCARYVVEHQLFGWIVEQNSEHGVAPSRDQLVEKALCFMPSTLPSEACARCVLQCPATCSTQVAGSFSSSVGRAAWCLESAGGCAAGGATGQGAAQAITG